MNEILFIVDEAPGGFIARAVGSSIFTVADDLDSLDQKIQDAVACHFEEGKAPQRIVLC